MPGESFKTTNHATIRTWVEDRGGKPAAVKGTAGNNDIGMLRILFPNHSKQGSKIALVEISWDQFFTKFDDKQLALLYQETTANGQPSRFFKFIRR